MRALTLTALLALTGPAFSQVDDAEIAERMRVYQEDVTELYENSGDAMLLPPDFTQAIDRVFDGLAIEELSPKQIIMIHDGGLFMSSGKMGDALRRCRSLMEQRDETGAMAALAHARLMVDDRGSRPGSARYITEAINAWLDHPEVMSTTRAAGVFLGDLNWRMEYAQQALIAVRDCGEGLDRFARDAFEDGSAPSMVALTQMLGVMEQAGMPAEKAQRFKDRLKSAIGTLLEGELEGGDRFDLEQAINTLTQAEREAALVGSAMPQMDIAWSSDNTVDSFDDYCGKVLVIDFWATWCGPCIMSFPKLQELQERYEGHDVVVLGVTSHQGVHVKPNGGGGGGVVDCSDDPAKEQEPMLGFMEELGMTWPVVFTEESCMNPDFGVSGIPHVAVIDPAGVVRHTGLTPFMPLERKTLVIDALLEEFGLVTPNG